MPIGAPCGSVSMTKTLNLHPKDEKNVGLSSMSGLYATWSCGLNITPATKKITYQPEARARVR